MQKNKMFVGIYTCMTYIRVYITRIHAYRVGLHLVTPSELPVICQMESSSLFKSGNKAHKHKQETYRQTDRQYK